jgi:hypothetical protein
MIGVGEALSVSLLISFHLCIDAMAAIQLETGEYLSYSCLMKSVEEIEDEIAKLKPIQVRQVAKWLAEYEAEIWDKQIEDDAAAGKLDRFIKEALEEYRQGKTRPLP